MMLLLLALATITSADVNIRMPAVHPAQDDTYECTSFDVSDDTKYLVGFEPKVDMQHAHHMLLYGCGESGSEEQSWNCGEMQQNQHSPCKSSTSILFAWAMEGKKFTLPPNTGFKVGDKTKIKKLVLQIHYKNVASLKNKGDSSGLRIKTQSEPTEKIAGVYLLATDGEIPGKSTVFMEAACSFNGKTVLHPFAFRTHTHKLGKLVSGFKIGHNGDWSEIGRKNPQDPQLFYPVQNKSLKIMPGDKIAARCVMKNQNEKLVKIGSTRNDEMCNFYMMYWVNNEDADQTMDPDNNRCVSAGWPGYKWAENLDVSMEPMTAAQVPGSDVILKEAGRMEKEMNKMEKEIENELDSGFIMDPKPDDPSLDPFVEENDIENNWLESDDDIDNDAANTMPLERRDGIDRWQDDENFDNDFEV